MITHSKISYRVIAVTRDSEQIDLSQIVTALGWSEAEKELAAKITFKIAATDAAKNISIATPIIICADSGDGFQEVVRGNVSKLEMTESNGDFSLNVEAADEAQALRQSQDDYYFSPDASSSSIIKKILDDHGVPHTIQITDVKHGKKVYRGRYLADMIADVLKDLKEKGGGVYFLRSNQGVLEIIPRGTNETIYQFDIAENLSSVKESFDASKLATKVKVVGKQREEGHRNVDAIVEGRTDLGVRQLIYQRGDKESLQEAETAAKKLLDERGVERKTSIDAPDIPFLRKGDRVRVKNSLGESYFFVKAIRHNAAQSKMTVELDEDKEKNQEAGTSYDTAWADENSEAV
ncbi:MAG: hypothetical protein IKN16_09955 [Selenomonadaceae bacterium]|nr:hypothetical protein [Selenomonadaceae bacterium]